MNFYFRILICVMVGWILSGCDPALIGQTTPQKRPPDVDKFAGSVLNSIQLRSFENDREYCGVIGYDDRKKLVASPASRGGRDGCIPLRSPNIRRVVASYHTHGAASKEADTEAPSYHDILADVDQNIDGYISTPGGRFWKIDHKETVARLICGPGCLRTDPKHVECKSFPTKRSYTAKGLFDREMNDTGRC